MAGNAGLEDLTWDGGTSASIIFGKTRVTVQKFSPPKVTVKIDTPMTVGQSLPRKRTPGKGEMPNFAIEMLASDYESQILPRFAQHGSTLIEFIILIQLAHPSVKGSLKVLLDAVRTLEIDGPEINGDEKAAMMKFQMHAMRRYDAGRDGVYKSLAYDASRPSSQARALMKF